MKKAVTLFLAMVLSLGFTGCGDDNNNGNTPEEQEEFDFTVKEPELVCWKVLTHTGIPTFVGIIKNNNKVPVDITFNLEFYKDGKKIYVFDDMYYNCLPAGEKGMVWATKMESLDVAGPEHADKVKFVYTYADKSYYTPMKVKTITDSQEADGLHIAFESDTDYDVCEVSVAHFLNNDLVAISTFGYEFSAILDPLVNYDSHEVFYNVYKYVRK